MGHTTASTAFARRGSAIARPRIADVGARLRELRSKLDGALVCLCAVLVTAVAVIAFDFAHPVSLALPTVRAAAETVICWLAVAGVWLLRAQFIRTRRLCNLLLFGAFVTLALTEFSSYAVPSVLYLRSGSQFAAVTQCGELIAAALFAAAAVTRPDRLVAPGRSPLMRTAAVCMVAFLLTEVCAVLLLRDRILGPVGLVTRGTQTLKHPLGVSLAVAAAMLFGYAAWMFALAGRRNRDGVLGLLGGALIVLAAARLDRAALTWSAPGWIAPREMLRLLAFALILAAALRQELRVRARAARAAAAAERRRVARDLHDGIAQDLAFLAAHSSQLSGDLGTDHPVTIAIRRALALSRGTISELSDWSSMPTDEALEAIATELRERFEIGIAVEVEGAAELATPAREHLTRITREAIANAARHGGADNVTVSLKRIDSGVALKVRDDGCGIGARDGKPVREGFGLRSIHERAAALGGCLTVRDCEHGGTELEVVLP